METSQRNTAAAAAAPVRRTWRRSRTESVFSKTCGLFQEDVNDAVSVCVYSCIVLRVCFISLFLENKRIFNVLFLLVSVWFIVCQALVSLTEALWMYNLNVIFKKVCLLLLSYVCTAAGSAGWWIKNKVFLESLGLLFWSFNTTQTLQNICIYV